MNALYINAPYQSAHWRAGILVVLLFVGAVVSFLSIPVGLFELFLPEVTPDQELADNPGGFAVALLRLGLSLLTVGLYVATVILFLMWLYRACRNLPAFGANRRHIGYSPGWAVGSFFVPFINLVVPYRAVKELWQKSDPAVTSGYFSYAVTPPGFFSAWWGFWIASNIANNVYFRMSGADAPREATTIAGIAGDLLSIAAAALAVMVVREIDRRQEEASRNLPTSQGRSSPPPPPAFDLETKLQRETALQVGAPSIPSGQPEPPPPVEQEEH